ISYHRQITKETLLPLIQNASTVACRSGYSTLMDLVVLDKKAIIIPTPGQTEQEYLGNYLHREGIFYHAPQQRLDLQDALEKARSFPFRQPISKENLYRYKKIVDNWLAGI